MDDEEWTDEEVWAMNLTAYSPASLIARKMRLVAEVSEYMLPRVKRIRRQIARTMCHIDRYLAVTTDK